MEGEGLSSKFDARNTYLLKVAQDARRQDGRRSVFRRDCHEYEEAPARRAKVNANSVQATARALKKTMQAHAGFQPYVEISED